MNVLLLTSTFPAGRSDMMQHPFQLEVIDTLRRNGHRVTVLTQDRGGPHEEVRQDLDVVWFPWRRVSGRLAEIDFLKGGGLLSLMSLLYNGVKHARRAIRQKGIDSAICLWVLPSGFYMFMNSLLRTTRVPYILWALGSDINKYRHNAFMRLLLRTIIRRSSAVFADGLELCDSIRAISGRSCEFLPTFRAMAGAKTERSSGGPISFLYVGRHARVKGIDLLMAAIDLIEKSSPGMNYRVAIAGDGELTAQLMNMAAELGLAGRVTFAGRVGDEQLGKLYSQSDCVIIPSRSESIPVVFSEALQFNIPMIVTDVGDMGVLGRRYGVARIVPAENAPALAGAMQDFIANPFLPDPRKRDELLSVLSMERSLYKLMDAVSSGESR